MLATRTSQVVRRSCRTTATKAGEWLKGPLSQETQLVHAGVSPEEKSGAILTPVYMSTTFVQESVGKYLQKGFSYSRTANPTVAAYEQKIAQIEGGCGAIAVSTGMAATTSVISTFMAAGDHCVITDCSYGGTNRICREQFQKLGMEFSFVDFRDLNEIKKAIKPNTKLIFSESPANPTLTICDLDEITKLAHENNCVHVCDSTFATPVILRPLDHGCDLVIQSLTKFYDGHNMTVGGAVIAKKQEHFDRLKLCQNMHGNIMSPWTAFLQMQTAKTMAIRVRQQSETAMKIAEFLESHPKVTAVTYPGLKSFPQKALADKYHRNNLHGAMLWFDVKGGSPAGTKIMDTIQRPWSLCENLGAIESIITACAVMTHANMLKEDRLKVGISDGFIRVSCGLENADDLIKALSMSLDQI